MRAALRRGRTQRASASAKTTTPIKHVIVIVGENHTFDNVFATYKPRHGQTVKNLLSEGIVRANGTRSTRFTGAPVDREGRHRRRVLHRPQTGGALQDATGPEHHLRGPEMRRRSGHERRRLPVPRQPAECAIPDHEVRAVRRGARRLPGLRQRRLRGRSAAPVLPDEPADRAEPEQAVGVDGRHGRRLERGGPDGHDRPGRRVDGLLQRAARRCAGARLPRQSLLDVRQLPPGGDGRDGHQSRRPGHRLGGVLRECRRRSAHAAGQSDRESQSTAGDEQLLHPGWLLGRHVLRSAPIRRSRESGL